MEPAPDAERFDKLYADVATMFGSLGYSIGTEDIQLRVIPTAVLFESVMSDLAEGDIVDPNEVSVVDLLGQDKVELQLTVVLAIT